jgi:hypothetical protein
VTDPAEDKIRRYMATLRDPLALVDTAAVDAARAALQDATDPVDRLKARQHLLEVSDPDTSRAQEDFVAVAKSWAAANGISAESFLAEKVPGPVLRRAGLWTAKQPRARRRRAARR